MGLLSLLANLFAYSSNSVGTCNDEIRNCVEITFTSQLGVREHGSANAGFSVEKYLKSTNLNKGYAWCAAFVNWTYNHCGIKTNNSAWSPAWFTTSKTINKHYIQPRAGDVFGIYFKSKKRIAHVGFIYKWDNNSKYCMTVEGNTNSAGSREGDGVYMKRRLKTQIYKVANWIDGI